MVISSFEFSVNTMVYSVGLDPDTLQSMKRVSPSVKVMSIVLSLLPFVSSGPSIETYIQYSLIDLL